MPRARSSVQTCSGHTLGNRRARGLGLDVIPAESAKPQTLPYRADPFIPSRWGTFLPGLNFPSHAVGTRRGARHVVLAREASGHMA